MTEMKASRVNWKMKLVVVLAILLVVLSVPVLILNVQTRHANTAKDRVERLLNDKSSPLSKSMVTLVGDYESVEIEGAYPRGEWRSAMVDGQLKVGQKLYWFRIIDQNGVMKIEATTETNDYDAASKNQPNPPMQ